MKTIARIAMLLGAVSLAGCATSNEMGWHHPGHEATEVQVASCDAATATLKGQHDHDISNRACLDAKVRQGVD
jgi:hypothetical protein